MKCIYNFKQTSNKHLIKKQTNNERRQTYEGQKYIHLPLDKTNTISDIE